jgi:hypothetical protein
MDAELKKSKGAHELIQNPVNILETKEPMDDELKGFFLEKSEEARELIQDLIKMKEILEPYATKMKDPKMHNIVDSAIEVLTGLKLLYSNVISSSSNPKDIVADLNIDSLISLADELDQAGLVDEASIIDEMIKSAIEISPHQLQQDDDLFFLLYIFLN